MKLRDKQIVLLRTRVRILYYLLSSTHLEGVLLARKARAHVCTYTVYLGRGEGSCPMGSRYVVLFPGIQVGEGKRKKKKKQQATRWSVSRRPSLVPGDNNA